MAEKLLKPKSRMACAAGEVRVRAAAEGIVLVGSYKSGQLEWIAKNGVYNWPARDGDEFAPES